MIRDWWRGYSDIDLAVARLKLQFARMWSSPGGLMALTREEFNSIRANPYAGHVGLV